MSGLGIDPMPTENPIRMSGLGRVVMKRIDGCVYDPAGDLMLGLSADGWVQPSR
jgi:hypothetical protein